MCVHCVLSDLISFIHVHFPLAAQDEAEGEGDEEDGAMQEDDDVDKPLDNDESTMDVLKMKPQSSF